MLGFFHQSFAFFKLAVNFFAFDLLEAGIYHISNRF